MSELIQLSSFRPFQNELARFGEGALMRAAFVKRLKPGETLYREGEPARACYQVANGVIKQYHTLEDGRRQISEFCGAGDFFGVAEAAERLQTAEAVTNCVVRCAPREEFFRTLGESPKLSRYFIDALLENLRRAEDRLVLLGRKSAAERVASFLLRVAAEQDRIEDLRLEMSRQDMADHLGLTIETVCRVLSDFKLRGLIFMPTARRFNIIDSDALKATADRAVRKTN